MRAGFRGWCGSSEGTRTSMNADEGRRAVSTELGAALLVRPDAARLKSGSVLVQSSSFVALSPSATRAARSCRRVDRPRAPHARGRLPRAGRRHKGPDGLRRTRSAARPRARGRGRSRLSLHRARPQRRSGESDALPHQRAEVDVRVRPVQERDLEQASVHRQDFEIASRHNRRRPCRGRRRRRGHRSRRATSQRSPRRGS